MDRALGRWPEGQLYQNSLRSTAVRTSALLLTSARSPLADKCGTCSSLKRNVRQASLRLGVAMNNILFDLRYAVRSLGKSRSFSVAAILSLAIGIGATAAVFSIANALLLRPLPYKDPDRLVILWNRSPGL